MTIPVIVDCSFWQDDPTTPQKVNFPVMAESANGVIIRAGQNVWVDKSFAYHWQAAKGVLPRGSYWFYDSRADPKRQAELWVATLNGDYGELEMFCDFEDNYNGAYGTWRHWYDFMEAVKSLVPNARLGVYTGFYYWVEKTVSATNAQLAYFAQYPLWIAAYKTSSPKIPDPWKDYKFWQFTDSGDGVKYGVESREVDLNLYNGTLEQFQAEYGISKGTLLAQFDGNLVEYRRK